MIALSVESQRSGVDYCLARLDRLKMGEQQIVRGFDEALRSGGVLSECRQRVLISIAASLLQ